MPRVSVITVCRNNKAGLAATLDSIRTLNEQECIETIVIDGHSTDDTDQLIADSGELIDLFVKDEGSGIYGAMNQGVSLATGEYIIFMNAGDCFAHDRVVEEVVPELKGDLVFGRAVKDSGEVQLPFLGFDLAWKRMPFSHQSLFARAAILREHPFNGNFPIAADFDFVLWCLKQRLTFRELDVLIAEVDAGGVSEIRVVRRVLEAYSVVRQYYSSWEMHCHYIKKLRWAICVVGGRMLRNEK